MSLITELIERLRKEADGYMGYRSKRAIRVKHLLREAADTIETLSAKVQAANMERTTAYYNGGWIPVSERLPDKFDRYLISTDDGRVETIGYGYTDDLPNEIAFHEWDDEEWQCWKPNVTAWMPLPEPYEPQERSDKA